MSLRRKELLIAARTSLSMYCLATHRNFQLPRHIVALIGNLERLERSEIDRFSASVAPRHGKSLLFSEKFIGYFLGRHPERNVILCTYSQDLAADLGRRVQRLLQSSAHLAVFPESKLATEFGSLEHLELQAGGNFYCVSRSGALSGRGGDLLVIDDIYKDQAEASSVAVRQQVMDFWERVALTRLSPDGRICLIGTRWHHADLYSHVLAQGGDRPWTVVNYPALAESNDPLGRQVGEALWPERFSAKWLLRKRQEMNRRPFDALYQGRPTELEGSIFQYQWWRRYTALPSPIKRVILSLDTANKTASQNDYSAAQVWVEGEVGFFLAFAWRDRLTYPDLRQKIIALDKEWNPSVVLIEDTSAGSSLVQELQASTSLPVRPIKVDRDKIARAEAVTPLIENGRVYLPQEGQAPWLDELLKELTEFPKSEHDDQVDSLTQSLAYLRGSGGWLYAPSEELKSLVYRLYGASQAAIRGVGSAAAELGREILAPAEKPTLVDAPPPVVEQCPNPNCGSRNLTAQPGVWEIRCQCGWSRPMTPEEIQSSRSSREFQESQQGWRGDGYIPTQTGASVSWPKVSTAKPTAGPNDCPVCAEQGVARPLAQREDPRGTKIWTCHPCGYERREPYTGGTRRGGGKP